MLRLGGPKWYYFSRRPKVARNGPTEALNRPENTGRYYGHVWWDIPIDAIDADIDAEGYVTAHPNYPRLPGYGLGVDIESIDV